MSNQPGRHKKTNVENQSRDQSRDGEVENYRAFAEFAKRMVQEYKANLVAYATRCQDYMDQYSDDEKKIEPTYYYWLNEQTQAMALLGLSDAELMPLIKTASPYHLGE